MTIGNSARGDFVAETQDEMLSSTRAVIGSTCLRVDISPSEGGVLYVCIALPSSDVDSWVPFSQAISPFIQQDGHYYMAGPNGLQIPLIFAFGTAEETEIGGIRQSRLWVDQGSDAPHAQILWAINCTLAGNPSTPDHALASNRFANYATAGVDVFVSGIDGTGTSEQFLITVPAGATMMHFALAGETAYTADADETFGGTTMGYVTFPDAEETPVAAIIVKMLSAGGTNNRTRELSIDALSE